MQAHVEKIREASVHKTGWLMTTRFSALLRSALTVQLNEPVSTVASSVTLRNPFINFAEHVPASQFDIRQIQLKRVQPF